MGAFFVVLFGPNVAEQKHGGAGRASRQQWQTVADVLSASCSNIHGVRIDDAGGKLETDTDGLTKATWAYSWNTNSKSATLILQSGGGTAPITETAFVHAMAGGISFVSVLSGATWVHTLYADGRKLLVSEHSY